jgi:hypothetical protein
MSQKSRTELIDLLESKVLSGGRRTKAEGLRLLIEAIVDSTSNINDDADSSDGFIKLNNAGTIEDISKISDSTPTGRILTDSGQWEKYIDLGNEEFNGDGSTTVFLVNHVLGKTPGVVLVTGQSLDGSGQYYVSNIQSTSFEVIFRIAPSTGVKNVKFNWLVK